MNLLTMAAALALLAGCAAAGAGEEVEVPGFAFADPAAAAAAWRPNERGAPAALAPERTPDGRPAVAFRCDMPRLQERAYWDWTGAVDLSRHGRIALWIKAVGDLSAVASTTLYFRSGDGWYGAGFGPPEGAWRRVTLDRSAFAPEDAPGGWRALTGMRLSFWKGQDRAATVYVGGVDGQASDVVVVRSARGGDEQRRQAEATATLLARAGADCMSVDDTDVADGALEGKRVAVYPMSPGLLDAEAAALERFVAGGGKVLALYTVPERLAGLLGIRDVGWLGQQHAGQFAAMRFDPGALPGLPAEARQASWNIVRVEPADHHARVIGRWFDAEGRDTGYAAVVVSDTGAYVSHVLLPDDAARKEQMARALLGHLAPPLWKGMADGALARAGRLSRWERFGEAERGVRALAARAGRRAGVDPLLDRATAAYRHASSLAADARYPEALEAASEAGSRLTAAYAAAQPSRAGEFRGVWCHSAYGVEGLTWDEAARRLKEAGFTAVVPNMLWGGVADYPSKVLPVRDRVARDGDAIARCIAASRKTGIQVHVWKVNWNLSGAPDAFVARMRAEGRMQSDNGGHEVLWLCPSHPANFALERDSMLEVVRNYDVDGIHFDYIRYPDSSACYCGGCRRRFEEQTARPADRWPADVLRGGPRYARYQEFRRSNITRLVRAVSEEAHRIKPWIRVSAAVFPNWPSCREEIGQDWGRWVREGWLDFVCPMDYSASSAEFRTRVQVQRGAVAGRVPLYPGIGASAPGLTAAQVIDQVAIARAEGADGFIVFNYDAALVSDHLPALGRGATAVPAHAPHEAPAVEWTLRQAGRPVIGEARAGLPIGLAARLTLHGPFRRAPRAAEGVAEVRRLDDTLARTLGPCKAGGAPVAARSALVAGQYRLVVRGTVTLADGSSRPFTARGPLLRVVR
ncbi:MAG: family 10 glycosylhydrolase [Chthonomonadales bacterium]|nr:family 10 glycosylhydrolase [Chthonomonadales bacterium]